jgi:DNA excision repair protein ERCC-6-like 2
VIFSGTLAHRLKSSGSLTTKAAKELKCTSRFGLTGTVMQNKLEELWTLIDWASPGLLGCLEEMRNQYVTLLL